MTSLPSNELLFPKNELPRTRKRQVLMHVVDAGCCGMERGKQSIAFECGKCGFRPGWTTVDSVSEARRGIPCPKCNAANDKKEYV